jgi:hypothetical protein
MSKRSGSMNMQEKKKLKENIKKQTDSLKKSLSNEANFKRKDDWKKLSFITEGGDDVNGCVQSR